MSDTSKILERLKPVVFADLTSGDMEDFAELTGMSWRIFGMILTGEIDPVDVIGNPFAANEMKGVLVAIYLGNRKRIADLELVHLRDLLPVRAMELIRQPRDEDPLDDSSQPSNSS